MAKIYHDADADLGVLKTRQVGIIGYGNQGRAQALNLRDSGIPVMVGNLKDEYGQQARADGFGAEDPALVAKTTDVLLILIPDEIQAAVYQEFIAPGLRPGKILSFASGYNIHFQKIVPPAGVEAIMVAPRMIGSAVRRLYQEKRGFPCLVGVRRPAGPQALPVALALAKGIGATRLGAFASSFEEETVIDLFAEQMLWPGIIRQCLLYFEMLVANGCDPEVVASELHLSGEFVEIAKAMITQGFFEQLLLHSQTSQYGQLSRAARLAGEDALTREAQRALDEIRAGTFAQEWSAEQAAGKPNLAKFWQQARRHPLAVAEKNLETLRKAVALMLE